MTEDTTEDINVERKALAQTLEQRLDQLSTRLDRLEALQEDEQRHWKSLVQELIKTRMLMREAFKA